MSKFVKQSTEICKGTDHHKFIFTFSLFANFSKMESWKQIYNHNIKEQILYTLSKLFWWTTFWCIILMNNISFLLSTTKIISGELRNLTEFKQGLIQLSYKSLRYLVVNMVSEIIFPSTAFILVVMNDWSIEFSPQYTMMERAASHLQLLIVNTSAS